MSNSSTFDILRTQTQTISNAKLRTLLNIKRYMAMLCVDTAPNYHHSNQYYFRITQQKKKRQTEKRRMINLTFDRKTFLPFVCWCVCVCVCSAKFTVMLNCCVVFLWHSNALSVGCLMPFQCECFYAINISHLRSLQISRLSDAIITSKQVFRMIIYM